MEEQEYLLKLIDEILRKETKVENIRLELDPGFIVVRIGEKNFMISVNED
jgi:hypothetical protein